MTAPRPTRPPGFTSARYLPLAAPHRGVKLGAKKLRTLQRRKEFLHGLAWLSVAFVTAMFLSNGGATTLTGVPDLLGRASRLTALLATNLLLIQMLLIARHPWIDRAFGQDAATLTHKRLGKPVLYLAIAHVIASVVQFAMLDGSTVWAETVTLVTTVPDMLTATLALAAMILVVVTSVNLARRRIPYEAWYLLHLFGYAAVILAVPHQFSTGTDIAGKPVALTYWVALYAVSAASIARYRILRPVLLSARHRLKVHAVTVESSDSASIYLTGNHLDRMTAQPGQFFHVRVLTWKQWWHPHPFSLSAAPNGRHLRFTIGNRGDDTSLLQNVPRGTRVLLEGPYGTFTETRRTREKVVLIASGIGIPPIRALAETMASRPGDITIIYRVRNAHDAVLLEEVRHIASTRGHRLHVLEGPRGHASSWLPADGTSMPDQARLTLLAPWVSESDVYICGPTAWTHSVIRSLRRAGTPEQHIHSEEFAW